MSPWNRERSRYPESPYEDGRDTVSNVDQTSPSYPRGPNGAQTVSSSVTSYSEYGQTHFLQLNKSLSPRGFRGAPSGTKAGNREENFSWCPLPESGQSPGATPASVLTVRKTPPGRCREPSRVPGSGDSPPPPTWSSRQPPDRVVVLPV